VRWVVTGSGGQLGQCLVEAIRRRAGEELVAALSHADLDVADAPQVERLFERVAEDVDVVVNAAAFTAVDRCETEPERAFAVNAEAPERLARACRAAGVRLVHVSTDYVFDGRATAPYAEDAPIAPATEYGRGKAEGERRVLAALPEALIVRTSWVFGPGRNFVVAILEQAARRRRGEASGPLRVVDDQRGSPTYAADLAQGVVSLAAAVGKEGAPGLFHLTNAGETTWFAFAREILSRTGHGDVGVEPIATAALELPAPRPAYSVLDCGRAAALGVRLRRWPEALADYLATPPMASWVGGTS